MKRLRQIITLVVTLMAGALKCFSNDKSDTLLVKECVLNYAEGWYSGDASRMTASLHPDFEKAIPVRSEGSTYLKFSSYIGLVEGARNGTGVLDEEKRNLKYQLLEIKGEVAIVRINSAMFNDYIQLLKTGSNWKIVNVLWSYGIDSPKFVISDESLADSVRIGTAVNKYVRAFIDTNVALLERTTAKEYSRVIISRSDKSGLLQLSRKRYSASLEECSTGEDAKAKTFPSAVIEVTDIMYKMAVVRIETDLGTEFLQLYEDIKGWKVLNSLKIDK